MYARVSAVLLALVLAISSAAAQETTGRVSGRILDAQGLAIPGATVTLTGAQGARTFVTDADGNFTAPFLTPGTYTVRAELQGFKAAETRNVNVSLGQTTTVNLNLQVGGLTETVEVTGAASVIDTRSTTTGAVLSSDMLSRVPVGRRVTDTLYIAPGVTSSGSAGRANPSISGSTGLDNQYVIDGVNVTNTGYGAIGSYSIIFGSLGSATPYDFVKEVQVKTGGYEAEFGQSLGGVVNVVTKSGTNQLRGSVFGYTRPDQLEAGWRTVQTANGTVNTVGTATSDLGIEGGFPILRDKLFVFAAINPTWEKRTFVAPEGPEFPLNELGEIDRERRLLPYSTKVTWQIGSAHRVDGSFFGDPSKGELGPQRTSSLEAQTTSRFSEITYGGHNQTVRYDGVFGSNFLFEASFARAKNLIEEVPSIDEWLVQDQRGPVTINSGGIGFFEAGNDSENLQYAVKATNVVGGHQVRYGITYDDVTFGQLQQLTGPTFTAPDGRQTATGAQLSILPDATFGQIYRVIRANFSAQRDTHQKYFGFFAQDSWKASDRLTVNAGIRYEQQALIGTIAQLPTLDGEFLDEFALKNNWAPRIGVVYDVLGNGRSKLFANYGRFFARVPNDLAARILSSDEGITRADYFDAGLTRPIPEGTVTLNPRTGQTTTQHFIAPGGGEAHTFIDPDAKLSYKDEFAAGFEYEAFPNTNVGVRYIYRTIGRALEDVGLYPMVACELGSEGACAFDTYVMTNPDENTNVIIDAPGLAGQGISFEKPEHTYNAIELTMDRRFSENWSLIGSYRWSRLHGTYEGFFREDNGQSDPALTSLYDYPTNDPTYSAIGAPLGYLGDIRFLGDLGAGPLPLDRPHQFKVFGNYQLPVGLSVGVGFTANSGKPLTALAGHPTYGNSSEIPLTARGEGFETVDGFRTRTPFETQLDLQASYSLNLAGNRRVTLIADAFNLFNLRRVTDYNAAVEQEFGTPNPDFGTQTSDNVAGQMFQAPFQLRFGARFEF